MHLLATSAGNAYVLFIKSLFHITNALPTVLKSLSFLHVRVMGNRNVMSNVLCQLCPTTARIRARVD